MFKPCCFHDRCVGCGYEVYSVPEFISSATMVFGGDVNLSGEGVGEKAIFSEAILNDLKSANFAMINLECAVTDQIPIQQEKRFQFVAPSKRLKHLTNAGVDAVSLANNHVMDAGAQGLESMLRSLTVKGLVYTGAGGDKSSPVRALNVRLGEVNVAFIENGGEFKVGASCVRMEWIKKIRQPP